MYGQSTFGISDQSSREYTSVENAPDTSAHVGYLS